MYRMSATECQVPWALDEHWAPDHSRQFQLRLPRPRRSWRVGSDWTVPADQSPRRPGEGLTVLRRSDSLGGSLLSVPQLPLTIMNTSPDRRVAPESVLGGRAPSAQDCTGPTHSDGAAVGGASPGHTGFPRLIAERVTAVEVETVPA